MVPVNHFIKVNVRHQQKVSFSTGKVAMLSSNSESVRKISKKTPMLKSFQYEIVSLKSQPATLSKQGLQNEHFPGKFQKNLKTAFLQTSPDGCFSIVHDGCFCRNSIPLNEKWFSQYSFITLTYENCSTSKLIALLLLFFTAFG